MTVEAERHDRKLEEFLKSVGAANYPHVHGRSLYDHLKGTRDILRCWSQPFAIQTAGLLHSIYSTDVYRLQVLQVSERERLKSLIGKDAERLVYLFHKLPRQRFFDRLRNFTSIPSEGLVVPLETADGVVDLVVSAREVFGLVVVHMANEAEQVCLADGKPGLWLARVSELGTQLHKGTGLIPPVFDNCSLTFSSDDERQLNEAYNRAFDAIPIDLAAADVHLATCSRMCPWVGEPLILRAYVKTLAGETNEGCELSLHGKRVLDEFGTAWDKRLSWSEWKQLAQVLLDQLEPERLKNLPAEPMKEPRTWFDRVMNASSTTTIAATSSDAIARLEEYISSFGDPGSDSRKRVYPSLPSQPFHDPSRFPIVRALENACEQIKDEVTALQDEDFHPENETISRVGAWDVFFFYERGNKNISNCERCPTITSIIEQHDTLRTQAGLIYLSRLRPGTHIAAHHGPTNIRLRCHLGIQVPEGDCALRVGNEVGSWKQGRCLVFDDYYEHEAWNRTAADRIVLIVDLWHSSFTPHEREILKGLHEYAFVHAQGLHRYWIENMKSKFTAGALRGNVRSAMHDYH